jgi:hypothetical protein
VLGSGFRVLGSGFVGSQHPAPGTQIEINPEPSEQSHIYDEIIPSPAGRILPGLFMQPEA